MWTAKEKPDIPDIQIENTGIFWNKQTVGWLRNQSSKEGTYVYACDKNLRKYLQKYIPPA